MTTKSIYGENTHFERERHFTISVLSENRIGLLHSIAIIFTRRRLNLESINVSDSEVPGISRYTFVLHATRDTAEKVVKQIEKLVEVLAAFLYEDHQINYKELALYKISKKVMEINPEIEQIIKNHGAKLMETEPDYEFTLFEKTGTRHENRKLYRELEPFGISEFVSSGRIAISKSKRETTVLLEQLENSKFNVIEN